MTGFNTLPDELIEKIFEYLSQPIADSSSIAALSLALRNSTPHTINTNTMASLSLVSKRFSIIIQSCLYRHIAIDSSGTLRGPANLHRTLIQDPRLVSNVRSLAISSVSEPITQVPFSNHANDKAEYLRFLWALFDIVFPQLEILDLSQLNLSVKELKLDNFPKLKALALNFGLGASEPEVVNDALTHAPIEKFHLKAEFPVDIDDFLWLSASPSRITVLNLETSFSMTFEMAVTVAVACPLLEALTLTNTDTPVYNLQSILPNFDLVFSKAQFRQFTFKQLCEGFVFALIIDTKPTDHEKPDSGVTCLSWTLDRTHPKNRPPATADIYDLAAQMESYEALLNIDPDSPDPKPPSDKDLLINALLRVDVSRLIIDDGDFILNKMILGMRTALEGIRDPIQFTILAEWTFSNRSIEFLEEGAKQSGLNLVYHSAE